MGKRITWPPKGIKPDEGKNRIRWKRDGEPSWLLLKHWDDDGPVMTSECITRCCDCGLEHLHTYEIGRIEETGNFWLMKKAYRLPKQD